MSIIVRDIRYTLHITAVRGERYSYLVTLERRLLDDITWPVGPKDSLAALVRRITIKLENGEEVTGVWP